MGKKQTHVIKVNAFTSSKEGGNPAGVVLHPNSLTETQMKHVSQSIHVSETAFVFPSTTADYLVRFFSPLVEVDLCGHATIATFTVLGEKIQSNMTNPLQLTQETKLGILPVRLYFANDGSINHVLMQQKKPLFEPVSYQPRKLANILNISIDHLRRDIPQQRVSTGLFTLPVCVSSYEILKTVQPDFQLLKRFCKQHHVGSLHVFTFDTLEKTSLFHARNFAPCYGINEDPVTGTANGAVSSYLRHHNQFSSNEIICEQGDIIGRSGRVQVSFIEDEVWVGGKACITESIDLMV
ncbi:MAG: PhzF family phenazine biosynthesis protein [Candidatus Thermoplasmatota archaeon]|nr:PhzF family phenazine biosynthesis protein [Candidatus Thermoplasmatota archaeon]